MFNFNALDIAYKIVNGHKVKTFFKLIIVKGIKKQFYKTFAEFISTHSFISLIELNVLYGALLKLGYLDAKIKRCAYLVVKEVIEKVEDEFVADLLKSVNYLVENDAIDSEMKAKILQIIMSS